MTRDIGDLGVHRHRGAQDVTEAFAWCQDCQEERAFRLEAVDVAGYDVADLNPVLQDAVNGEPLYRCGKCGRIEADLVSGRGYAYELRDTGYEVGQWQDEEPAGDEDGAPPKPEEWNEDTAMEPRGRGVHPDRLIPRVDGLAAPRRRADVFE